MSVAEHPLTVQRFQNRDVTLAADVAGPESGQPVILLHGGGQTRQSWGAAMREGASRGFRMVNLDARGHGDSDWAPDGRYGIAEMIGDLAAVTGTLRAPPVLVGASMGGIVSLVYAGERRPLKGLVLVDIAPKTEASGIERIAAFMQSAPNGFASLQEAADAVAAYVPHRPRPKDNSGLMKNLRLRDDGRLHWHWDPRLLASGAQPDETMMREAARRLEVPTLLVRGRQSDVVSPEGAKDFLQLVPHAEFADIAGADHMVAGDRNDAFNAAVFDFLAKHT
jgi:pimeloyl-ACP methyl ester carboxylesterase